MPHNTMTTIRAKSLSTKYKDSDIEALDSRARYVDYQQAINCYLEQHPLQNHEKVVGYRLTESGIIILIE